MLPEEYAWVAVEFEPDEDPGRAAAAARALAGDGNLHGAATAYDRAFGLNPSAEDVRRERQAVLERLAVVEHGILFRYVPGGTFLMGSQSGEPDERPWHPVYLSPYWLSETPVSWAQYCRLMGWEPPPAGFPPEREDRPSGGFDRSAFHLYEANKIRLQYCEDQTSGASDWHAHMPGQLWQSGQGVQTAQEIFGTPPRDDAEAPWAYDTKPMVAVAWQEVGELTERLNTPGGRYSLPTEAQWEKGARGGLIGARHAWGNDWPSHDRCDFDRFHEFSIRPMRTFPPNGYGLYAMNGGVWEWTGDWYDRDFYRHTPGADPVGPAEGQEKVLRGGSWADCAEVVTVSFRMSRGSRSWRDGEWGQHLAPNIGFRLCRSTSGHP